MKVAIDLSPLKTGHYLQHRVRGTGFYLYNLKSYLPKADDKNQFTFFDRSHKLVDKVDLIHIPYFEPFFITLPFFNRIKTVVTVHDLTPLIFPKNFPAGFRGNLKWKIQRNRLKKCNRIITDSFSSKKDIANIINYPEEKIDVVYLAAGQEFKKLEKGKWEAEVRKKYSLPDKFILYVGDATWNKNLPRLIKAVKEVDIPLIMVGKALADVNFDKSNPWNSDLLAVSQLAEDKNIIELGFISTDDLIAIYNLASLFIMPSLYEGFGLPILEAMACGCPVITSKEGSLPEVAGEAAFYVDPYNQEDIAQGIKKLFYDQELRKQLSIKGLEQSKKFSWEKTAKETINAYEKVFREE